MCNPWVGNYTRVLGVYYSTLRYIPSRVDFYDLADSFYTPTCVPQGLDFIPQINILKPSLRFDSSV